VCWILILIHLTGAGICAAAVTMVPLRGNEGVRLIIRTGCRLAGGDGNGIVVLDDRRRARVVGWNGVEQARVICFSGGQVSCHVYWQDLSPFP